MSDAANEKEERRKEALKIFLATIPISQENQNHILLLAERWADAAFDFGRKNG